jgi:hypothetical protein
MSKNADHEEHAIDDAAHATHIALHQRVDALKDQIAQIHTRWKHAVAVQDFARQRELIAQERALIAEAHTILEAFQASWIRLHPEAENRRVP